MPMGRVKWPRGDINLKAHLQGNGFHPERRKTPGREKREGKTNQTSKATQNHTRPKHATAQTRRKQTVHGQDRTHDKQTQKRQASDGTSEKRRWNFWGMNHMKGEALVKLETG